MLHVVLEVVGATEVRVEVRECCCRELVLFTSTTVPSFFLRQGVYVRTSVVLFIADRSTAVLYGSHDHIHLGPTATSTTTPHQYPHLTFILSHRIFIMCLAWNENASSTMLGWSRGRAHTCYLRRKLCQECWGCRDCPCDMCSINQGFLSQTTSFSLSLHSLQRSVPCV